MFIDPKQFLFLNHLGYLEIHLSNPLLQKFALLNYI